jgi:GTP cyclohydrolase I
METFNTNSQIPEIEIATVAVRTLLQFIKENPDREGLLKTPMRVANALLEMTAGGAADPAHLFQATFSAESYDEMIVCKGIEFQSLCEHHLMPFFGQVHVAYIPDTKVIGLSKMPRLVEIYSRRLQIQERLTRKIAEALHQGLSPRGVGVVIEARHCCLACRGVRKQNAIMQTSALLGCFRQQRTRLEFFGLIRD